MFGTLDHLVYAVPDLEASCDWFEEHTGIRPAIGGRHPDRGTWNAVVNLGKGAYLEIIAVDPENKNVSPPRWMGVDSISQPTITRWALKSDNLERDAARLADTNPALGQIVAGNRDLADGSTLRWKMTLPAAKPLVELLPFFLDWSDSSFHPTERMREGYELMGLSFGHFEPRRIAADFARLGVKSDIEDQKFPQIRVRLKTPKGVIML